MEIVLKSLASAVVTAIILVIAKYSGPKLAGAIGGIPIVFAISYILITMDDKNLAREFLIGGIYGAIAAIFFSIVLIWLNAEFIKMHWVNFAVAYIACFLLAFGLAHFTTK
ncbi:MAG: hypothetical protein ACD_51C00204G0001 [uncultured bacterium]|nr:MAG: hypothetical protein ACD_51C00204G0001 [uncultured bacterium]OGJ48107.1 MAG: hypothetical protein A2244_01300 [Candidatus Peregrinibacteria bacterium RIFOXYA2_FULL_41_18]OGJ49010.1 MAG: hypothetical protein A2344_00545 [Candidatus Peregrinibacteria bacterium RIFOXYB12_FULL_41_12]OGJ53229.1 MAG: hypothetical protein A2448_04860 [Candidatus Peregrinibacteria bacterium RIFOXYC2_FULL_41_22]OGJ54239.1 MAG: hypothetical protein A2336_02045 [Candidatus Peregrinibacteria bacterium RIFOXYB2_FULL